MKTRTPTLIKMKIMVHPKDRPDQVQDSFEFQVNHELDQDQLGEYLIEAMLEFTGDAIEYEWLLRFGD